jgi:hypothetical protein
VNPALLFFFFLVYHASLELALYEMSFHASVQALLLELEQPFMTHALSTSLSQIPEVAWRGLQLSNALRRLFQPPSMQVCQLPHSQHHTHSCLLTEILTAVAAAL